MCDNKTITINGQKHIIKAVEVKGFKRYRGKGVCNVLGYRSPRHGINHNVSIDNRRHLK